LLKVKWGQNVIWSGITLVITSSKSSEGAVELENLSKYVHGLNTPAFELISDAAASFGYTPSCIRKVLKRISAFNAGIHGHPLSKPSGFGSRITYSMHRFNLSKRKVILKFQIGFLIGSILNCQC